MNRMTLVKLLLALAACSLLIPQSGCSGSGQPRVSVGVGVYGNPYGYGYGPRRYYGGGGPVIIAPPPNYGPPDIDGPMAMPLLDPF